ncbi:MAG: hypothetical protein ACYTET_06080 [Planctomycetota bacterium]
MTKTGILFRWSLGVLAVLLLSEPVQGENWPRTIQVPEGAVRVYQPQLESFEDNRLTCRSAVGVLPDGFDQPVFGAVWLSAQVATDRDSRMVYFSEVNVPDAKFTQARPEQIEKLKSIILQNTPNWDLEISLDRLLTMLNAAVKEKRTVSDLKHAPPKVIFRKSPAVLVVLDGHARLSKTATSGVQRVVNTPYLMLFDEASATYYLKGGTRWFRCTDIPGSMQLAQVVPPVVQEAVKEFENPFVDPATEAAVPIVPEVIVVEEPAELIVTAGEPKYASLEGGGLLYVSNTSSDVFQHAMSQDYYILLSGRWYRTTLLGSGMWEYVKPDSLPPAFSRIGTDSPKGHVLCSVAGTVQADDAVMNTYIPQTAAIDRKRASLTVEYDGPPEFKAVEGLDVAYAMNTSSAVFRVKGRYYCCQDAVWFEADTVSGPWRVCGQVPDEIYKLPPSCPHYPVRFVQVYDASSEVVYTGYTPGYTGCYVVNGAVVYGTGYAYRGWYRGDVYPRPSTFGYAAGYDRRTDTWGLNAGYRDWCGRRVADFGYRNVHFDITQNTTVFRNLYYDKDYAKRPSGKPRPAEKPVEEPADQTNNVYAGPKGDVYRRQDERWQVHTEDGWQMKGASGGVYETQPSTAIEEPQEWDWSNTNLEIQYQIRDRGNRRTRDYTRHRPSQLPAGGRTQ